MNSEVGPSESDRVNESPRARDGTLWKHWTKKAGKLDLKLLASLGHRNVRNVWNFQEASEIDWQYHLYKYCVTHQKIEFFSTQAQSHTSLTPIYFVCLLFTFGHILATFLSLFLSQILGFIFCQISPGFGLPKDLTLRFVVRTGTRPR